MATERELMAWRDELRPFVVGQLSRMLGASAGEAEADGVLSQVLLRWHEADNAPGDPQARRNYVARACMNWVISYRRGARRTTSLDALGEGADGEARPERMEAALRSGYALSTGAGLEESSATLEHERGEYARQLRAQLDWLAWGPPRASTDVYLWLVLLLELRATAAKRLWEDGAAWEVDALMAAAERSVLWDDEREARARFAAAYPTLWAVWSQLVGIVARAGEASQGEICQAFRQLDCELHRNTYQQWGTRLRRRVAARCDELGVPRAVVMRTLLDLYKC